MQACRPRSLICPLQLGLAVQYHNMFQSRIVVDELNAAGFCSSYYTAEKFEKCAAMQQGTCLSPLELEEDDKMYSLQYMADNIDHNISNLDGRNTFHAMGMMATITPATKLVSKIKSHTTLSKDELINTAKVNIPQYMFEDVIIIKLKIAPLKTANST